MKWLANIFYSGALVAVEGESGNPPPPLTAPTTNTKKLLLFSHTKGGKKCIWSSSTLQELCFAEKHGLKVSIQA